MRFAISPALAAALLVCAAGVRAQSSPTYDSYRQYSQATNQAIDDMGTANDNDDVFAGCRAAERVMYNARYTANALVDLIEETKADGSIDADDRARRLQFYRSEWDDYNQLARDASNGLDACSGINYR
ncbi:MAG: hypothetical protein P0Y56_02985 [Candidatus Andeanibacterium colombiense]|uniref:Uncharacterized protein n=1 Tax=Candidatus Andeanibacterium colombiense TaxID=3121345 RepID=A0AAJ5X3U8_9SPHN|nr:MAG: hypothetical protein P0Y56_02985 [Sphingomonadaceae bacterium]